MAHFEEQTGQPYDWGEGGVYVIEREDPVDGGLDGVSNRQGRELTRRTRNLHGRLAAAEGEIDTLQEELPIATEAAKRSAIEHTEGQVAAVRDELALGDQAAINTAKAYADRIVAALVDNSPELLNTLEELAAALGGDPEFATTVMTEIGKRATMSQVNTALAGKFDKGGGELAGDVALVANDELGGRWIKQRIAGYDTVGLHFNRSIAEGVYSQLDIYSRGADGFVKRATINQGGLSIGGHLAYHKGNLVAATTEKAGLMSADDKRKLSTTTTAPIELVVVGNNANLIPYALSEFARVLVSAIHYAAVLSMTDGQGKVAQIKVVGQSGQEDISFRTQHHNTWRTLYHSGNLKIIRGSVNTNSNGIWCSGGQIEKIEPNYVKVTHNIGHTRYSATATAHAETVEVRGDNVVTVFTKGANYTLFMVTDGQGNRNEPTAFDFIIIAE